MKYKEIHPSVDLPFVIIALVADGTLNWKRKGRKKRCVITQPLKVNITTELIFKML